VVPTLVTAHPVALIATEIKSIRNILEIVFISKAPLAISIQFHFLDTSKAKLQKKYSTQSHEANTKVTKKKIMIILIFL